MTDAPASSKPIPAGFLISRSAGATVSSAKVPTVASESAQADPNTSSPGCRSVTFPPVASTTPATSLPRTGVFGPRSPERRRRMYGTPATVIQSGVFTLVARTRTRTSSSPTGGGSISAGRSTCSGGPYPVWTTAFTAPPPLPPRTPRP